MGLPLRCVMSWPRGAGLYRLPHSPLHRRNGLVPSITRGQHGLCEFSGNDVREFGFPLAKPKEPRCTTCIQHDFYRLLPARLVAGFLHPGDRSARGSSLMHGFDSLFQTLGLAQRASGLAACARSATAAQPCFIFLGNLSHPRRHRHRPIVKPAEGTYRRRLLRDQVQHKGRRPLSASLHSHNLNTPRHGHLSTPTIPSGPLADKWRKLQDPTSNSSIPANKRKYHVVVVGAGLAGASAAASLWPISATR